MMYLPAIAMTLSGITILFLSWRRRIRSGLLARSIGWGLLFGSILLWVLAGGAEYGSVFSLLAFPFVAWLFVFPRPETRTQEAPLRSRRTLRPLRRAAALDTLLKIILVIPVAGLVSAGIGLVFVRWLPWSDVDNMAFAVLSMPVTWGALAVWACMEGHRARAVSGMIALTLMAGIASTI